MLPTLCSAQCALVQLNRMGTVYAPRHLEMGARKRRSVGQFDCYRRYILLDWTVKN